MAPSEISKLLFWLSVVGALASGGCSSLHNAYERKTQQSESMLEFSTCEGRLESGNGKNVVFRYEIMEGVKYRGARATKVKVKNVIGGVGYEMSIYDVYGTIRVESLASLASRGGSNLLNSEIEELHPDVLEISSHFGRLSMPGGTYDISRSKDLSKFTGIKNSDGELQTDANRLFESAMYDAAVRKSNDRCD